MTSRPRRRRDLPPRKSRVAAAAPPRLATTEEPRRKTRRRRDSSPRKSHVAAAAPPRLVTTEEPRRGRGAAATRFHGVPAQVFDTSVDWHKSLDAFKKFDLDRRKIDPRDPRQEGGARSTKNPPPQ